VDTLVINSTATYLPDGATFVVNKVVPEGKDRINDESNLIAPELLRIRHSSAKGGAGNPAGVLVDRHLVQLSRVLTDAETGERYTVTTNLTFTMPRTSVITDPVVEARRALAIISNLVTGAVTPAADIAKSLMRGES
jgi:hypothetical protein